MLGALSVEESSSRLLNNPLLGIDVSPNALQHGKDIVSTIPQSESDNEHLSISFIEGDGLRPLSASAQSMSDAVVTISGMGVSTMKKILNKESVEALPISSIILQPTNSKPRNILTIYDHLRELEFQPAVENIGYYSGRFYITTTFIPAVEKLKKDGLGENVEVGDDESAKTFKKYFEFHEEWMRQVEEKQ